MNIKKAGVAGIAGTLTKTLFSYLSSLVEDEQVTEPELLGTLLTKQTGKHGEISKSTTSITLGYTGHLLTGIAFSACYDLLWSHKVGKPDFTYGFIFGLTNGIIGSIAWRSILHFHIHPPKVPIKTFTRNMIVNHVLFGITTASIYRYVKAVD